jgi:hypothetical protein
MLWLPGKSRDVGPRARTQGSRCTLYALRRHHTANGMVRPCLLLGDAQVRFSFGSLPLPSGEAKRLEAKRPDSVEAGVAASTRLDESGRQWTH